MKKIDMINEMIEKGYIDVCYYALGGLSRNKKKLANGKKTIEAITEEAIHYLQYHVLKEKIEKMYENYLTYCQMNGIM